MSLEQKILDSTKPNSVDREIVRGWLVEEASRLRRRNQWLVGGPAIAFLVVAGFLFQSMQGEAAKIRSVIAHTPTASANTLEELTNELCSQPPADYWMHQLTGKPRLTL